MTTPLLWGKCGWLFLHYISLSYPDNPTDEDKKNYALFIYLLKDVLPCRKCRNNFAKNIVNFPLTMQALESKKNLVKWMIDFHNIVNDELGKKQVPYEKALDNLKRQQQNYNKKNNRKYIFIIAFLIVVIICLLAGLLFKN